MLLIEEAAEAGANAVKGQLYSVPDLYSIPESSICKTLRECAFTTEEHLYLRVLAEAEGMEYLVSVFDLDSLRVAVEEIGVSRIKIGSGDLTDHRLLRAAAETGLPIILSTGMSTRRQIDAAIYALRGPSQATLLECVSSYPAPPEETNLRWLPAMGAPWGLSHHGPGIGLPVAAVALGARVIEVHITTSRSNEGPDHAASMEPPEFRQMVTEIRRVEAAMGPGGKRVQPSEWPTIPRARKMLATSRPVKQGEEWTEDNLTCLRAPGEWPPVGQSDWKCLGLEADWYFDILGQTAQQDYGERVPLARVEKEFP
jgi:sialic acid synthase SpsE